MTKLMNWAAIMVALIFLIGCFLFCYNNNILAFKIPNSLPPTVAANNSATPSTSTTTSTVENIPSARNITHTNSTTSSNNFLTYESPIYGIRMQYPSDWLKNATLDIVPKDFTKIVEFYHPSSHSDLVIIVQYAFKNDLRQELLRSIKADSVNPNEQVLEANTNATLANHSAYLLVTEGMNGNTYKTKEIGSIIGDKLYILNYLAQSATDVPTLDKMIDSFIISRNQ